MDGRLSPWHLCMGAIAIGVGSGAVLSLAPALVASAVPLLVAAFLLVVAPIATQIYRAGAVDERWHSAGVAAASGTFAMAGLSQALWIGGAFVAGPWLLFAVLVGAPLAFGAFSAACTFVLVRGVAQHRLRGGAWRALP